MPVDATSAIIRATDDERRYLACCYAEPDELNKGIAAGLTADHFDDYHLRHQWKLLCELLLQGKPTDAAEVYATAVNTGRLESVGGMQAITDASSVESYSSINAAAYLSVLLARRAKRESWLRLHRAKEMVEAESVDIAEVGKLAEEVVGICGGTKTKFRPVADIAKEAFAEAEAQIAGKIDTGTLIMTGLPSFDRYATPMQRHEYVVVAGRSSHGKSSLMVQVAGHNLRRKLKVAYFQQEGSAKTVIKQIASQWAQASVRNLQSELKDSQRAYLEALKWIENCKNLLVFDQDSKLTDIQARCRLIAQSFKPDLVIIDYLGCVGGLEGSAYERASAASKAMIPLQKALGCVLMAGSQFNQGPEKEAREPTRTDFRDSGQILEDAHRVIGIWRKPDQQIDQLWYDCELLQLKLRDGGTAKVNCRFHAPTTRFVEAA